MGGGAAIRGDGAPGSILGGELCMGEAKAWGTAAPVTPRRLAAFDHKHTSEQTGMQRVRLRGRLTLD